MKKTLSTILLGASLFFGNFNETKSQCSKLKFDNEKNEIYGFVNEEIKRIGIPLGTTILYYKDTDKDGFYDFIISANMDLEISFRDPPRLIVEEFNVNKNTGEIEYFFRRYRFRYKIWKKYINIAGHCWDEFSREKKYKNLKPLQKEYYPSLSANKIYDEFADKWRERVKVLINGSKDAESFRKALTNERNYWENIFTLRFP